MSDLSSFDVGESPRFGGEWHDLCVYFISSRTVVSNRSKRKDLVMLACTLRKSIITEAKILTIVSAALLGIGQKGMAQSVVTSPYSPVQSVIVTNYQQTVPVAVAPPANYPQSPAYVPAPVYVRPAAAPSPAVRRSGPPSMSRSSFSERWRADLKASGRGHRP